MKISVKKILAGAGIVICISAIASMITMLWMQTNMLSASEDSANSLRKLEEIHSIVEKHFYEAPSDEELYTGAFRGLVWALDDSYSYYATREEVDAMQQRRDGNYYGIGVQIIVDNETNLIKITRAFRNSPAAEAGLRTGDCIIAVDGEEVSGYERDKAVEMLKGEEGTEVIVTVLSGEDERDVAITRGEVEMNRVDYRMIDDIGYIEIDEFVGDDVEGFEEALRELRERGAKGFVLDLRDNPGGLVEHVVKITDLLVPGGKIVYTIDREGEQEIWNSDAEALGMPLAVLVNGMSASASEILAGAVQDYRVGTIIGEKTFGKGIVQTMFYLSDGSGVQITTSSYYTPNGRSIHGTGIEPDITVEVSEYFERNRLFLDAAEDAQLQKALEVLRAEIAMQDGIAAG